MGMPVGGGSSWAHHADGYDLIDDGGVWGRLTIPVTRDQLSMMLAFRDTPMDSFWLFQIDVERDEVMWKCWIPEPREVAWTPSTPATALVAVPDVCRRASAIHAAPLGELQARLVAGAGEVSVVDAAGRPRVQVRLGDVDPRWGEGERGVLGAEGRASVAFFMPTGPGVRVRASELSMP